MFHHLTELTRQQAGAVGHVLAFPNVALMMIGVALGVIVGAIPGMTGAMLIALSLPITYGMEPSQAMVLLVSMYVGSVSGGLITATLLRMPGTPASMMTTLDGYPLAKSGRPGRALGLGISASLAGGLISWVFLAVLSRPIAEASHHLGPFDLFSLVVVALVMIASVSGKSLAKGIFSGLAGMMAAIPGESPATGTVRWTGGFTQLDGGFNLLPVLIGLFAISQIIRDVSTADTTMQSVETSFRGVWMTWNDWRRHGWNVIRSSLIGTWIGILPGIGANIGSVMAYSAAKNVSRRSEEYGNGSEEGIVASEAANNATVGGALIPLVAMGIPGSVIDAILLGALILHGLQPGTLLMRNNPEVVYTIMGTMLVANVFMAIFMLASLRWLARLMQLPRPYLTTFILVSCVVGSFALNNRTFDIWVMLAFGLLGYAMERLSIPLAPFVIGFVLAPLAEQKLTTGLQVSGGSYAPLVTSPMSLIFLSIAAIYCVWSLMRRRGGTTQN